MQIVKAQASKMSLKGFIWGHEALTLNQRSNSIRDLDRLEK